MKGICEPPKITMKTHTDTIDQKLGEQERELIELRKLRTAQTLKIAELNTIAAAKDAAISEFINHMDFERVKNLFERLKTHAKAIEEAGE